MELTKDTKAILALTLELGAKGKEDKPLTNKEYNLFAKWLKEHAFRPRDVLGGKFYETYSATPLPGLEVNRLKNLIRRSAAIALRCESWLNTGMWIVSRADSSYPSRLKRVLGLQAPLLLFGYGEISQLDGGGIGVVGSRNASDEALRFARRIGEECAKQGRWLVSGGAKGCDEAAIQGALKAHGQVIVVLFHDLIKTALLKRYTNAIQINSVVMISTTRPDAHFNIGAAMARNKVIYALSDAVVVAAARYKTGGTWAGATEAIRKWKIPVYVRRTGEVGLMQVGAKPVSKLREVLVGLDEVHSPEKELIANSTKRETPLGVEQTTKLAEREIFKELADYCMSPRSRNDIYIFLTQYKNIKKNRIIENARKEGFISRRPGRPVKYVRARPKLV